MDQQEPTPPRLSLSLALPATGLREELSEAAAPTAYVDGKQVRLFPCLFCDKRNFSSRRHSEATRTRTRRSAPPPAGTPTSTATTTMPPSTIFSHGGTAVEEPLAGVKLEEPDGTVEMLNWRRTSRISAASAETESTAACCALAEELNLELRL
ncbi:unnamed protein product [Urochloa humidicola]